jgi:23S rRNA pseudouridine2605 synthase
LATTAKGTATTLRRAKGTVSLERALSKLGLASRSQSRALIEDGRVTVDGTVITDPSRRLTPERATILIDGAPSEIAAPLTIALHKPRGYLTTRSDPKGRKTVYDLLGDVPSRVVPVGRLDLATSGLLILSNDTHFANWLTDPSSGIDRVYLVTVEGRATDDTVEKLVEGVDAEGEWLRAESAVVRKASNRESHLTITLREGKNREIRRLMAAAGHPVTQLRRVQFGGLALGSLAPGKWRTLTAEELSDAFPRYLRRRAPSPK